MSIAFTDSAGLGPRTSHSYPSVDIGAAAADRYVLVIVGSRTGVAGQTYSVPTIGGVSMTELVVSTLDTKSYTRIYIANVTSGTTTTIAFTVSGVGAESAISVYRLDSLDSASAFDTVTANGSNPMSGTIDIPTNGVVIAGAIEFTTSATWTGLTKDVDQPMDATPYLSTASDSFASAITGRTISSNFGSGSNGALAGVSLTFGGGGGGDVASNALAFGGGM